MIAERIKELWTARGWTQAELARRLNMTRNGLNSWEQRLSMPSPAFLVELAKTFCVSTDYLLGIDCLDSINVTGLSQGTWPSSQNWRSACAIAEAIDREGNLCGVIDKAYHTGMEAAKQTLVVLQASLVYGKIRAEMQYGVGGEAYGRQGRDHHLSKRRRNDWH